MTTYWISLVWEDTKDWKHSTLPIEGMEFSIDRQEFWVQQFMVFIYSPHFEAANDSPIYLCYGADEFGWYETLDKAKRAVESYLTNVLHYDFNS